MDFIIELLSKFDSAVALAICIIVLIILLWIITGTIKHRKDIMNLFNSWFESKSKKNELIEIIYDNQKRLDEYEQNRIHDREQSFTIQKQLTDAINIIGNKMDAMEEKHNKRVRAELKDKISQLYRYYHEKQCWNDMEKEAFDDLVEEYEAAGGKNSFVHTIVQPESCSWEVVDRK